MLPPLFGLSSALAKRPGRKLAFASTRTRLHFAPSKACTPGATLGKAPTSAMAAVPRSNAGATRVSASSYAGAVATGDGLAFVGTGGARVLARGTPVPVGSEATAGAAGGGSALGIGAVPEDAGP